MQKNWKLSDTSDRMNIRSLEITDYNCWHDGFNGRKPKQHKYDEEIASAQELDFEFFSNLYQQQQDLALKDDVYVLHLFEKISGKHIGIIDIATLCRRDKQWANIGYIIHNQYQNLGYGTEALQCGLKIAVEQLKFHRIEAAINIDNERSIKIAKKAGMIEEGIRKEFIFENGAWTDHVIYTYLSLSI